MAAKMVNGFLAAAQGFTNLPIVRQLGLLIGLSASIAIGFSMVLWMGEPNYYPLYSNLPLDTTNDIVDTLQKANIKYKLDPQTNTLFVPNDDVYQARIKLASVGLPKSNEFGFANFDKNSWIGNSGFIENMRYKLALEGELGRTISAIDGIKAVRVHLALPKQSEFVGDTESPSASVLVELKPGVRLEKGQVTAIVQLVASSVTGLKAEDVKVADQEGNLLTSDLNDTMTKTKEQFTYQQELQNDYKNRLEAILTPLLGQSKVRAQVALDIDFTHQEKTQEEFNPKDQVLRSEQTMAEQKNGGDGAAGVAGSASNQPAGSSATSTSSGGDSVSASKNNATRNFEIGKTVMYSKSPFGKVERLNIAVVVDNHTSIDASGKTKSVPLTKKEIDEVTALAKNAVGFDKERGDQISVINIPFAPPVTIEAPQPQKIWELPWVRELAKKLGIALFTLLLALLVLRPALKSLSRIAPNDKNSPLGPVKIDQATGTVSNTLSGANAMSTAEIMQLKQQQLESLKQMVSQDPTRVAEVLKKWVGD